MGCKDIWFRKSEFVAKTQFPLDKFENWTDEFKNELEAEYYETVGRFNNDPVQLLDAVTKEHHTFSIDLNFFLLKIVKLFKKNSGYGLLSEKLKEKLQDHTLTQESNDDITFQIKLHKDSILLSAWK